MRIRVANAIRQTGDLFSFETAELLETRQFNISSDAEYQVTEIYPLRRKQSSVFVNQGPKPVTHEFWLTLIKGADNGDKNYVVSMIAPSRSENFYNWALAERAYKIVVESLK